MSKEDEVVKELVDALIPRVDAVTGPAHGAAFLVIKSQEDAMPPIKELVDAAAVEKVKLGTTQQSPGKGTPPSNAPMGHEDDGTNLVNSGDDGVAGGPDDEDIEEAAADGATGNAPGTVSAKPKLRKALDFTPAAEALFVLRKALADMNAPEDVLKAVDNVGETFDAVAKANTGEEPDGDIRAETLAPANAPTAIGSEAADSSVNKALTMTSEDVAKSLAPVLKSIVDNALTEGLAPLEKRLAVIEEQPRSGGPLMNGAQHLTEDHYLVAKGGVRPTVESGTELAALEKSLQVVTDPYLRERIQQEIARKSHPAHQG